ncbi:MAG: cupin domain-containing protein [Pseudomonadota bacterium]
MVKAHLSGSGEIYSLYAAGQLDPAFCLLLETQAALNPAAARKMATAELLSGIFLEAENEAPLSDGALQSAFDRIDALDAGETLVRAAANSAHEAIEEVLALPDPLRETVLKSSESADWQPLARGVRRLALDVNSAAEVELYRIEAGQKLPRHSHRSGELTLVVAGGYTDETGQFGPGELSVKGPDDTHQPVADMDGVCFALAVREDGLQFTGWLGALQRVLGQ